MEFSQTQIVLIIILIILFIFIFAGCGMNCGRNKEGFYDQIRDNVSNPFYMDDCGGEEGGCNIINRCRGDRLIKATPLESGAIPFPNKTWDVMSSTTCPECTTQVLGRY